MSTIPPFEAFTAYFSNMNVDELIEWLSNQIPVTSLSDEARAFM